MFQGGGGVGRECLNLQECCCQFNLLKALPIALAWFNEETFCPRLDAWKAFVAQRILASWQIGNVWDLCPKHCFLQKLTYFLHARWSRAVVYLTISH